MKRSSVICFCCCLIVILAGFLGRARADDHAPRLSFTKEKDGITILVDDQVFTRYLIRSGSRPVLWPIYGPTGEPMTRSYPVGDARPGEEKDHIHHRSMWIGYEGLGGHDFWHEGKPDSNRRIPLGEVKHVGFTKLETIRNTVLLVTDNEWLGADKEVICTDTRTYQFGSEGDQRWIDCLLELKASEQPLTIGDSKEGFFALRVASTMRADRNQGGRIVASTGKTNAEAWGRHAKWVDYHGPIKGETVGIAILSHPESYNPEPRWHVRPYGLFGPNPFGELAFTDPDSDVLKRPLRLTLPQGQSLKFRYRVIFHRGDEKQADIAGHFEKYAQQKLDEM